MVASSMDSGISAQSTGNEELDLLDGADLTIDELGDEEFADAERRLLDDHVEIDVNSADSVDEERSLNKNENDVRIDDLILENDSPAEQMERAGEEGDSHSVASNGGQDSFNITIDMDVSEAAVCEREATDNEDNVVSDAEPLETRSIDQHGEDPDVERSSPGHDGDDGLPATSLMSTVDSIEKVVNEDPQEEILSEDGPAIEVEMTKEVEENSLEKADSSERPIIWEDLDPEVDTTEKVAEVCLDADLLESESRSEQPISQVMIESTTMGDKVEETTCSDDLLLESEPRSEQSTSDVIIESPPTGNKTDNTGCLEDVSLESEPLSQHTSSDVTIVSAPVQKKADQTGVDRRTVDDDRLCFRLRPPTPIATPDVILLSDDEEEGEQMDVESPSSPVVSVERSDLVHVSTSAESLSKKLARRMQQMVDLRFSDMNGRTVWQRLEAAQNRQTAVRYSVETTKKAVRGAKKDTRDAKKEMKSELERCQRQLAVQEEKLLKQSRVMKKQAAFYQTVVDQTNPQQQSSVPVSPPQKGRIATGPAGSFIIPAATNVPRVPYIVLPQSRPQPHSSHQQHEIQRADEYHPQRNGRLGPEPAHSFTSPTGREHTSAVSNGVENHELGPSTSGEKDNKPPSTRISILVARMNLRRVNITTETFDSVAPRALPPGLRRIYQQKGGKVVNIQIRTFFSDFQVSRKISGEVNYPDFQGNKAYVRIYYYQELLHESEWEYSETVLARASGRTPFVVEYTKEQELLAGDRIVFFAYVYVSPREKYISNRVLFNLKPSENSKGVKSTQSRTSVSSRRSGQSGGVSSDADSTTGLALFLN